MIAVFLYSIWHYQIFKSVLFRGGMAFLTAYLIIIILMPKVIRLFRKRGITSDFTPVLSESKPYSGATPIMGGGVLIFAIVIATFLWSNLNQYIIALLIIMIAFGVIGAIDDIAKVLHKRRIEAGEEKRNWYSDKANGISGKTRLTAGFAVALLVVSALYLYVDIDGHLVIPFVPLKEWYPYLPKILFIPFMVVIIVGGANAVNLTDGMDSLAIMPLMTCSMFVAAVAYIGGDAEWSDRLKIPFLTSDIKELVVLALAIISTGLSFMRYNAPPALIYMGDLGALALGSTISAMFIFVKAELFFPIVGGIFVFSIFSVIIQTAFFKCMLSWKGRAFANHYRFFLRAPYHHHLQRIWTYSEQKPAVVSVWLLFLEKLGFTPLPDDEKFTSSQDINSRVVWLMHLKSIWLFVISIVLYFKVR